MNITPNVMGGGNRSYYIYHPRARECRKIDFSKALEVFKEKWRTTISICELYEDDNPGKERVIGVEQKREIGRLLDEVAKHRELYELEALAEILWGDQDPNRKFLPYYHEIKKRAMELRAFDSNLLLARSASSMNKITNPNTDLLKKVIRGTSH
jgi:hypothetical protein